MERNQLNSVNSLFAHNFNTSFSLANKHFFVIHAWCNGTYDNYLFEMRILTSNLRGETSTFKLQIHYENAIPLTHQTNVNSTRISVQLILIHISVFQWYERYKFFVIFPFSIQNPFPILRVYPQAQTIDKSQTSSSNIH